MFEKLKQLLKKKEREKKVPHSSGVHPQKQPPVDPVSVAPIAPLVTPLKEKSPQPPQKVKKGSPKKGKNGISLLPAGEDLEALFNEEGAYDIVPPPRPKSRPQRALVKPPPSKKQKKRDRNGILVLEDDKNIFALMAEEAEREGDRVAGYAPTLRVKQGVAPLKKVQKDRHGIPILEQGRIPSSKESGEFAALLQSSLSEKSGEVLLSEKVDKVEGHRCLTLKERLKRYPTAQGQLDLHGFTAVKADQTAEHYVRRAFSVGTYTLRLIVGKGLHSEHGAVLPDTIADRMTTLKQDGIVLAWEWEKGKKSKSGSILVYLNNYDSSHHSR